MVMNMMVNRSTSYKRLFLFFFLDMLSFCGFCIIFIFIGIVLCSVIDVRPSRGDRQMAQHLMDVVDR